MKTEDLFFLFAVISIIVWGTYKMAKIGMIDEFINYTKKMFRK
jgi:hypothetical protein